MIWSGVYFTEIAVAWSESRVERYKFRHWENQYADCGRVKVRHDSALNWCCSCMNREADGLQEHLGGKICRVLLFIGAGVEGEG